MIYSGMFPVQYKRPVSFIFCLLFFVVSLNSIPLLLIVLHLVQSVVATLDNNCYLPSGIPLSPPGRELSLS